VEKGAQKSIGKVLVAIVLVLVVLAGIGYFTASEIVKTQVTGQGVQGALEAWLMDEEGNRVKVPSGPLAFLAFYYEGQEVSYLGASVKATIESTGLKGQTAKVVTTLVLKAYYIVGQGQGRVNILKSGASPYTEERSIIITGPSTTIDPAAYYLEKLKNVIDEAKLKNSGRKSVTFYIEMQAKVDASVGDLTATGYSGWLRFTLEWMDDGTINVKNVEVEPFVGQ